MSRRIPCRSCKIAFVSHDDLLGRPVVCPNCGAAQEPQTGLTPAAGLATLADASAEEAESVFVPSEAPRSAHRGLRLAGAGLALLTVAAVAVLVAWPMFQSWWHPVPPDPVETVASAYLQALTNGDTLAAQRLGTVDLPPAIRTFRSVRHEKERDSRLKGSFAPITAFHARIDQTYAFDPSSGRFTPRNALGPAAETLDALHEAKARAEESGLYAKMRSGDPNDLFDAAEQMARPLAALSETVLSPRKLLPSYKQLVEDAKPPLPPPERSLALDFAANRETWDLLLKRPYLTLKADGPFLLDRAEVTASVIDSLGSTGDPPTPLRLTLTRFRLEGIDTGWRVTSARREGSTLSPAANETISPPPAPSPEKSRSRHDRAID